LSWWCSASHQHWRNKEMVGGDNEAASLWMRGNLLPLEWWWWLWWWWWWYDDEGEQDKYKMITKKRK
jgi:hypothetical protein